MSGPTSVSFLSPLKKTTPDLTSNHATSTTLANLMQLLCNSDLIASGFYHIAARVEQDTPGTSRA